MLDTTWKVTPVHRSWACNEEQAYRLRSWWATADGWGGDKRTQTSRCGQTHAAQACRLLVQQPLKASDQNSAQSSRTEQNIEPITETRPIITRATHHHRHPLPQRHARRKSTKAGRSRTERTTQNAWRVLWSVMMQVCFIFQLCLPLKTVRNPRADKKCLEKLLKRFSSSVSVPDIRYRSGRR